MIPHSAAVLGEGHGQAKGCPSIRCFGCTLILFPSPTSPSASPHSTQASSKFKCWLDELDVEGAAKFVQTPIFHHVELRVTVETRCQQMTHHVDQLVMTLSCHYGTQMLKLPKTVKQMKMKDFVAKYGSDIEDVSCCLLFLFHPYHVLA